MLRVNQCFRVAANLISALFKAEPGMTMHMQTQREQQEMLNLHAKKKKKIYKQQHNQTQDATLKQPL